MHVSITCKLSKCPLNSTDNANNCDGCGKGDDNEYSITNVVINTNISITFIMNSNTLIRKKTRATRKVRIEIKVGRREEMQ